MGVARSVVQWLREGGHDAVHLLDEGLERLGDLEIFNKAAREKRILLTFDLDFTDIAAASGGKSVSVVLFRLRRARAPQVRARLTETLSQLGPAIEDGAIVIVQDTRLRIRHLPIEQT
jgi:predicted nuclease of predicted toxin-antitoxin system